jgi:hypothetical protein
MQLIASVCCSYSKHGQTCCLFNTDVLKRYTWYQHTLILSYMLMLFFHFLIPQVIFIFWYFFKPFLQKNKKIRLVAWNTTLYIQIKIIICIWLCFLLIFVTVQTTGRCLAKTRPMASTETRNTSEVHAALCTCIFRWFLVQQLFFDPVRVLHLMLEAVNCAKHVFLFVYGPMFL